MTTAALEPALTRADVTVLRAVRGPCATVWQIAQALDTTAMDDLLLTLNGLVQLEYVRGGTSQRLKRRVYWLTPKGVEAAK